MNHIKLGGYFLLLTNIICIMFFMQSCDLNKDTKNLKYSFSLDIIDSLKINFTSKELQPVDYNDYLKYYLFVDYRGVDTILIIDDFGKIINKFSPRKELNLAKDIHIGSVGFHKNEILVATTKNIYIYNLDGSINKTIHDINYTDIWNYNKKIKNISHLNNESYIFQYLNLNTKDPSYSKEYYKNSKILTFINLKNEDLENVISYENSSILNEAIYGQNLTYFDYNKNDSNIYLLNNPDPTIYIYRNSKKKNGKMNFKLSQKIKIWPDSLPLTLNYKFNKKTLPDYTKLVSLNGQFMSLDVVENGKSLITYMTGMSENLFMNLFNSNTSESDKSKNLIDSVKFFGKIIGKDGISNEIQLPKLTQSVGLIKSDHTLILNPSPFIKNQKYTVFYIAKPNIKCISC